MVSGPTPDRPLLASSLLGFSPKLLPSLGCPPGGHRRRRRPAQRRQHYPGEYCSVWAHTGQAPIASSPLVLCPPMAGNAARGTAAAARLWPLLALPKEPFRLGALAPVKAYIAAQKEDAEELRACCAGCGAADGGGVRLRACDACDAVRYCGRNCQRADWEAHQLVCKILATDREITVRVGVPGIHIA